MSKDFTFVSELNVWAKRLIQFSSVYQKFAEVPVPVSESIWRKEGTVLDLLFNYTYNSDDFSIFYMNNNDWFSYNDPNVKNRLIIYRGRALLYVADDIAPKASDILSPSPYDNVVVLPPVGNNVSKNIYQITNGEVCMLKMLQDWKNNIVVDISEIIYLDLPSPLSRLIYLYLNAEIYKDYSLYANNSDLVNWGDRLIAQLYEKFILDHYYRKNALKFAYMKTKTFLNSSDSSSLIVDLTQTDIDNKFWTFPSDKPLVDARSVWVVQDSNDKKYDEDYFVAVDLSADPPSYKLVWDGKGMQSTITPEKNRLYIMWAYKI